MEDTPFDRPTDRVRKIMPLAREHAARLGHAAVAPGHLLLAILEEGTGVAAQVVRNAGIDLEGLRAAVEAALPAPGGAVGPRLPITPDLRAVLESAVVEAGKLGHDYVGSEHLLLALVDAGDPTAGGLLIAAGLDPARAHQEVRAFLGAAEKGDRASPRLHARVERVLASVHRIARECGCDAIDAEHLLLAILEGPDDATRTMLASLGLDAERVRHTIRARIGHGAAEPGERPLALTPSCHGIVRQALEAAMALGHDQVDLAHLLLGILKSRRGIAATTLQEEGLQLAALEHAASAMCGAGPATGEAEA